MSNYLDKISSEAVDANFDRVMVLAKKEKTFRLMEEDFPEGSLFSGCGGDWEFSTAHGWIGKRTFIGITGFRYELSPPWGQCGQRSITWVRKEGECRWQVRINS